MQTQIRPLAPATDEAIGLIAQRMRQTLIEVLGEERGGPMYTQDWLEQRVRWHLDPSRAAEIFVATDDATVVGHALVRLEGDDPSVGVFSTIYVVPSRRRDGVARGLLEAGERWMIAAGLRRARTYTDRHNAKLIALFGSRGYAQAPAERGFVRLQRALP